MREKIPHLALFGLLVTAACAALAAAPTERVSVSSAEVQGNSISFDPATNSDGRYVAFTSEASNLVAGDTNAVFEVFVRDVLLGTTERVSVTNNELQADNASSSPDISPDGRYVVFQSNAHNLIDGQVLDAGHVYLRDRVAGITELIDVSSAEVPGNAFASEAAVSGNGRWVVFASQATNLTPNLVGGGAQIFLRDRTLGTTELISQSSELTQGNGFSGEPVITPNGNFVAFSSDSNNLIAGGTEDGITHIYVHDRTTNFTHLTDLDNLGAPAQGHSRHPSISDTGRYVAFASLATGNAPFDDNVNQVYLRDRTLGVTELVSINPPGGLQEASSPTISGDGRYVAYEGDSESQIGNDTNGKRDIFVRDRQGGVIRVSVSSNGLNQANNHSRNAAISKDANRVAFESDASNLVAGDSNNFSDIFIRDLEQGLTPVAPGPLSAVVDPVQPRTRIRVTWADNSSNEANFQLERVGPDVATVVFTPAANVTEFLDTGLIPNVTYSYRIRGVNAVGVSPWSNTDADTTYPNLPAAPSQLTATAINKSRIDLFWADGATNEDGFKIERKVGGGAFAQIAIVGANVTTFQNLGLAAGTEYGYRVRAFNAPGGVQNSAYSNNANATTLPNPPAAPSNLVATATDSTTVGLTWTDNSGNETNFVIERRLGAGPYSVVATRPANTTSFTDGGRSPNVTYTYRMRSINSGGPSTYSNEAQAITLGAPSNLVATPVSPTQVNLTWVDNSPSDTGFSLERETGGVWSEIATPAAGATAFNNTGLTANTAYKYRIRSTRGTSKSSFSNIVNVVTPAS